VVHHEPGVDELFDLTNPRNQKGTPRLVERLLLPRRVRLLAAVTLVLGASLPLSAQCEFSEDQKFVPADSAPGDIYGGAVGISGDWLFNMSEWDDINGFNSGSAYIYRWNGTSWDFTQKIDPLDGMAGDNFGRSVAVQGTTALIGTHWDDTVEGGVNAGSAYIYKFDGSTWNQARKLVPFDSNPGSTFGNACAIDGNFLAVTSWRDNPSGNDSGSVYVWRFDGVEWLFDQKLVASDGASLDQFGRGVWISGNAMVIGAWRNDDDGIDSGCAYVFRYNGVDWVEEQKLRASDAEAGDNFGFSVSIDDDEILVGSHLEDSAAPDAGAAYFFRYNGSSWVEAQKVTVSDASAANRAGFAVALQNGTAIVSAHQHFDSPFTGPGAAYVFRDIGGVWTEEQKLVASDGVDGDVFSFHLALDADNVVVGAWRANNDAGASYVFDIARNDFNDDGIPDECQSFWADVETISLASGGTQNFNLDAGVANAGAFYRVFGTFTGTSPGLDFGFGIILPLNYDDYFKITLRQPGLSPFFNGFKGFLSASGTAVASFQVPGPFDPTLAGVLFHHAFVSAHVVGFVDFASNAIPVMLVP